MKLSTSANSKLQTKQAIQKQKHNPKSNEKKKIKSAVSVLRCSLQHFGLGPNGGNGTNDATLQIAHHNRHQITWHRTALRKVKLSLSSAQLALSRPNRAHERRQRTTKERKNKKSVVNQARKFQTWGIESWHRNWWTF
jgi:hypothetical protein